MKIATISFCASLLFVAGLIGFASTVSAAPNDLMAQSVGDAGVWVAQVEPSADTPNKLVTVIRFRGKTTETWSEFARLDGRVVSIAVHGSQLAVLKEDGEWLFIWNGGSAMGQPLPMAGQLRALADDGQSLWAIAWITGRLPTTRPATAPATQAAELVEATTQPAYTPRWMLFKLQTAGWQATGEINAPPQADVALSADRGNVLLAMMAAGGPLKVYLNDSYQNKVDEAATIQFSIVTSESGPSLWTAKGTEAGQLLPLVSGAPSGRLITPPELPANADRAVAISTGRLRLLFTKTNKDKIQVWEQKYDLKTLDLVGKAEPLPFPAPIVDTTLNKVFTAAVLAAMVFTVLASFQHRRSVLELVANPDRPEPAALGPRLLAGAIDFLPMLGGYVAFFFYVPRNPDVMVMVEDPAAQIIGLASMAVYILHTTVIEAIFGRSIGKMIVGLKIVGLDGQPAKVGPLIVRNLLRIIELTFLPMVGLLIVSPLRQRAGDIAAGTLVISAKQTPPPLPPAP